MRFWFILLAISLLRLASALAQEAEATTPTGRTTPAHNFRGATAPWIKINTTNVKALTPAWIFQTRDYAKNLQTTPWRKAADVPDYRAGARVRAGRGDWTRNLELPISRTGGSVPGFVGNRGLAIGDARFSLALR